MRRARDLLVPLELDATTLPALARQAGAYEPEDGGSAPRSYPGYPRTALPAVSARWLGSLERALAGRRSVRDVEPALPAARALARLFRFGHGALASGGRGPAPSAGGLQAVELFPVVLAPGWLAPGAYHYDRAGHHLSRVSDTDRARWSELVPSLADVPAAPLVLVLAGDAARVEAKYGARAAKLLLLEAGHVMQDLCLVAHGAGLAVVPCGGFLEEPIARALALPRGDAVLYAAACGAVGPR